MNRTVHKTFELRPLCPCKEFSWISPTWIVVNRTLVLVMKKMSLYFYLKIKNMKFSYFLSGSKFSVGCLDLKERNFATPFIFVTWCRSPLIFQTVKYQWFTPFGCKDTGIRKFELVARTQFLYEIYERLKAYQNIK